MGTLDSEFSFAGCRRLRQPGFRILDSLVADVVVFPADIPLFPFTSSVSK
jgi:hypothetical protein